MRTTSVVTNSHVSNSLRPGIATRSSRTTLRAIDLSVVPPLHWWRQLSADAFTSAHLAILRKSIFGIIIMNEPHWPDAVRGDSATAIGIALRTAKRHCALNPALDLVMSAVLLVALADEPAARCVLTAMINRYGRGKGTARRAGSWSSSGHDTKRVAVAIVECGGPRLLGRQIRGA
jgi:hypothetical protein